MAERVRDARAITMRVIPIGRDLLCGSVMLAIRPAEVYVIVVAWPSGSVICVNSPSELYAK